MSKKEALSQFQSRLAGRLQATQAGGSSETANWLAVDILGQGFMFPLAHSGEIFPWVEPQPVPYTKAWFLGVANLRGALCSVVSLAKYLDLSNAAAAQDNVKNSADKRLIGFHPSLDLNTVLAVDKLVGLKNKQLMTPTDNDGEYADPQGVRWQEIDLRMLAQNPTFISIAQ